MGLTLSGVVRPVVGGALAKLVMLARQGRRPRRLVRRRHRRLGRSRRSTASTPPAGLSEIDVDGVVVPADRQLSLDQHDVYSIGAVLYAAEACGLTGWCLDTASSYAKERVQFGRPIGTFQAIKHRAADMLVLVELMRAATWDAARSEAHDADGQLAVSAAASIALRRCGQGGRGLRPDARRHRLHVGARRAPLSASARSSVRQLLGPTTAWRTATAQMGLDGVRRKLDVELPAEAETYRAEVQRVPRESRRARRRCPQGRDRRGRLPRAALAGAVGPGRDCGPAGRDRRGVQEGEGSPRASVDRRVGAADDHRARQRGADRDATSRRPSTARSAGASCSASRVPGSDLASLSTKAEPTEGGWLITGQKVWTSLAKQATHGILLARTSRGQGRRPPPRHLATSCSTCPRPASTSGRCGS